ncbi:hypothetical protein [Actinokineospora terrae]|uniref:Secreted protein n=1 Tax=Actinokineospora terrae TaxID=155974 RepID=A0A1H9L0I0_9PSEU|nr:hypothetical protein [Actinokineospora terrae]SER04954.1 hypothetical protein SAMN04487818_101402 [Actinokineospora terrae]
MGHITKARIAFTAAAAFTALIATGTPALAVAAPGTAHIGSANLVRLGIPTTLQPIAQCSVTGPSTGSSGVVSAAGVKFGGGTSTCTTRVVDADEGLTETKSEATGSNFELSALVLLGGPRLKIGTWKVSCVGDNEGSTAGWSFGGLTGLAALPNPLPTNYVRELKGGLNETLATITFKEVTTPPDGSITLNVAHIRFLPPSGISGDVLVGATTCSPTP